MLIGIQLSRSAVSALHFVADQENVALLAEGFQSGHKRLGERRYAALPLHALDDDRARLVIGDPTDIVHVRFRIVHFGNERTEPAVKRVLPRRGQREERSAVEAVFQRDDLGAPLAVLLDGILPRRLERALVRLRARVCEERPFCARLGA